MTKPPPRSIAGESLAREMRLDASGIDADARTIPAALSSEHSVDRWFGREVLSHDDGAVNLERADGGLPLLWNHDSGSLIGNVRNVRLDDDGRLRGDLFFSRNARASEVWQDVQDGFLRSISIGYRIDEYDETDDGIRATRWSVLEASVVPVPADPTVGMNRAAVGAQTSNDNPQEGRTMAEQENNGGTISPIDERRAAERAATAERERIAAINERADEFGSVQGMYSLRDEAIRNGWDLARFTDQANRKLAEALAGKIGVESLARAAEPVQGAAPAQPVAQERSERSETPRITAGADAGEKFREAVRLNILARGTNDPEAIAANAKSELGNYTLAELARHYGEMQGRSFAGMERSRMVGEVLRLDRGAGQNDLAAAFADVTNKQLLAGYEVDNGAWRPIARIGTLTDFRAHSRVNVSDVGELQRKAEGGNYAQTQIQDYAETLRAVTYGQMISVTRETIVNDNLSVLTLLPQRMGQSAAEIVNATVIDLVVANPTLAQDGTAVFAAGHNNLGTGANAGAISETTLSHARKLLRRQKRQESKPGAKDGKPMNLRAEYLLVPAALETVAQKLMTSTMDANSTGANSANVFAGAMQVLVDPRLDDASESAWYAFASPSAAPTIEVAFLNGQQTPFIDSFDNWHTDGMEMKVRLDFDAAWLDFRGAYKNNGAA